jgi:pilus assembly protein CpaE
MAQQVMLAGARGFIAHPFTQINLLSTVRRLRDLERRRQKSQQELSTRTTALRQQPLRTIAVYSPRGGVGCSTVAANLAIKLQQQTNQQVLLMEGKLFMGHLGLMLNIRTDNTIADLVPHAAQMDESLVYDVTVEHASGIHVLLGPFDIQIAQGIRPEDLYNIVEGVQQAYDYVVIDIGTDLSENAVTMLDAADKVVVVMNPELASLHDAQRFVDLSRSTLAYPPEKLLFVLNRADMPGGVREQEIKNAMNQEIFSEIPDIGPKGLRSLNRGIPLTINYPRSSASRAFQKMTSKMLEMSALPSPLGGSQQAQSREEAGGLAPASGD